MRIAVSAAEPHVFITMPVGALIEAGISPTDVMEIYVEDEKIIIRKAELDDDFVCDGDCATCPFQLVDCNQEEIEKGA